MTYFLISAAAIGAAFYILKDAPGGKIQKLMSSKERA